MVSARKGEATTRSVIAGIWLVAAAAIIGPLAAAQDRGGKTIKCTNRLDDSHETSTVP